MLSSEIMEELDISQEELESGIFGNPYHYHFGKTDTSKLVELMKDTQAVDVRIKYTK